MLGVGRAVDLLGLLGEVGLPDVLDPERGQGDALEVAQEQQVALGELPRHLLGHIEGDRDGPQRTVGEPRARAHALVVLAAQEPSQRREAAVEQELEVAHLARRQGPRRRVAGQALQFLRPLRACEQVNERSAMRTNQM